MFIEESARRVEVVEDCDVCVVGGSCTGVFAAVRAAQLGARVAIIENNGFFGGVATAGLVNIWHTDLDARFEKRIWSGLSMEMVKRLRKVNAVDDSVCNDSKHYVLNTEELKIELDRLVEEAGVRPFFHARFVDAVVADDGRVSAVVIEDKSGRRAIKARVFVDATGDGDVIARAGLKWEKSEHVQPPTMCFKVQGLEKAEKKIEGFTLNKVVQNPDNPRAMRQGFVWSAGVPGAADVRMVAGTRVLGADVSDAEQLTKAEIEGRRQVRQMCDLLREAGADDISLLSMPSYIGARESRRAVCEHRLTEAELLGEARFDDAIANGSYRVDVHFADRGGLVFRYMDGREVVVHGDGTHTDGRWREEEGDWQGFYQVPYRSLVPQGTVNVLVAGRLIGTDTNAFGATRVMVNCNQTGEAAGCAAKLALGCEGKVGLVDGKKLRGVMGELGCVML